MATIVACARDPVFIMAIVSASLSALFIQLGHSAVTGSGDLVNFSVELEASA